ncbi:hypothetical protein GC105_07280 [Alkalibaculum sp. M08DMB]|uniref:Uncharacterized protein n=1 Tax=Alkalibaculum sporogenes TaxID=2655001 RepID=A0A6A7K7X3_9FIRM|nr:hypothetical protein [Alkalibaculum sporogenes]MPW25589.1 hypothetical protein [Alkalibaculum sporogenes]
MIDKNKMPLAIGIAFVAFTTQFGGGFASGAQLYQYFINYGIWTLIMPIVAQLILTLFFWYGLSYAYRRKTYDYRSFSNSFYGKYRYILSNLYEIVYLMLICLAPAVAFATGGSTLNMLTGIPYFLCTLIIGVFIFGIALFGTNIVRKAASTLSVVIIIGLIVVLVPNIIVQWDTIMSSIGNLAGGIMPVGSTQTGSFVGALWRAVVYALFQLASIGLMYQHVKPLTDEKQLNLSMIYMFIVNSACMLLAVFGMLAVAYNPELSNTSVPMLLFVQNGVGTAILTPIISILIILGAVSTGVNMIAGIVNRVVGALEARDNNQEISTSKNRIRSTITSFLFTVMTFAIAQFGLLPLIAKGYSYLGYATLIAIGIPFILHALFFKEKKSAKL